MLRFVIFSLILKIRLDFSFKLPIKGQVFLPVKNKKNDLKYQLLLIKQAGKKLKFFYYNINHYSPLFIKDKRILIFLYRSYFLYSTFGFHWS